MKIGIGVVSYKRPKECKEVCEAILNTVDTKKHEIQTICSLDSEDKTGYEWVESNFGLVNGPNKGVAVNKNRALKIIKDNEVVFLFEDDFKPRKEGWIELYIKAMVETNMQHFNHIRLDHRDKMLGQQRYPTITLVYYERNTAQLMVFTDKVIETIGAFDSNFGLYGYEHCDYTARCKKMSLCSPINPCCHHFVLESDLYFKEMCVEPCLDKQTIEQSTKKADKYYQKAFYTKGRIYIPFPEGEF